MLSPRCLINLRTAMSAEAIKIKPLYTSLRPDTRFENPVYFRERQCKRKMFQLSIASQLKETQWYLVFEEVFKGFGVFKRGKTIVAVLL